MLSERHMSNHDEGARACLGKQQRLSLRPGGGGGGDGRGEGGVQGPVGVARHSGTSRIFCYKYVGADVVKRHARVLSMHNLRIVVARSPFPYDHSHAYAHAVVLINR